MPIVGDPEGATSADLIRAAVKAGSLDDATGLQYRVYAAFGDPRLPAQFVTDGPHEDVEAMMRAPLEIDRLPPAVAAELRPYLARPTDPSSPFFDVTAGEADQNGYRLAAFTPGGIQVTVRQAAAAVACDSATHWGWAVGTHWFKVWGRCGDTASDGQIMTVVGAMEGLWEAETTYMNRKPNEDAGTPDQGGDTRIDVYLVGRCHWRDNKDNCIGPGEDGATLGSREFIVRNGVNTTSAFILIDRALVGNPLKLRVNLAHELFHALEYSYNSDGFFSGDGALWLLDASAVWAEWRFVQGSGPTEISPRFFGFQGSPQSLQTDIGENRYYSFAWPLFMEQKGGAGTMKRVWAAIQGKANHEQIMDAVNGVVSFNDEFRTFAMRAWNRQLGIGAPMEPLLPPGATGSYTPHAPRAVAEVTLQPTREGATPLATQESIPTLYGRYRQYKVHDDVGQIILDFSGLAPAAALDIDALVKVVGNPKWERRKLPLGKTTWCTDDLKDDIEAFVIVLSNHERRPNRPVTGTWQLESPRKPCLSYHITIVWTDTWNGVADTVVFDGYADQADPNAIGDVTFLTGTGTGSGSRAGYLACNPGLSGLPTTGAGTATVMAVIDGERVSVSAFADFQSALAGVNTELFVLPRRGGEVTIRGVDAVPGTICAHGYEGKATVRVQLRPP